MSTPPQMNALPDPSRFVDALCANMSLTQAQNLDLQETVQIGQSGDRALLLLHLITQANVLRLQNTVDKLVAQDISTASVLQDFKSKVTENWAPNEDDKTTVLQAIKEVLTDPHRLSFAKAADNVFTKLEQAKNSNGLRHAFKSQKRREILRSHVREITNNTKGQLRRKILETTLGDGKKSLLQAVIKIESSLKISFSEVRRPKFICRVSLWRRYARLCGNEPVDRRPPKRTSSGTEVEPETTEREKSEKKLESFWRGFDNWLEDLHKELGSDLDSEPWRRYYEETKSLDEQESAVSIAAPVPQLSVSMFHGLVIPPTQSSQSDLLPSPIAFSSSTPSQRNNPRPISRLPSRAQYAPPVSQLDLPSSSPILFSSPSTPSQRSLSHSVSTVPLPALHQPTSHRRMPSLETLSSPVFRSREYYMTPLSSRVYSKTPYSYAATSEGFRQDHTVGFATASRYTPDSNTYGVSGSSPFTAIQPRDYEDAGSFDESAASRSRAEHRVSRAWE